MAHADYVMHNTTLWHAACMSVVSLDKRYNNFVGLGGAKRLSIKNTCSKRDTASSDYAQDIVILKCLYEQQTSFDNAAVASTFSEIATKLPYAPWPCL